MTDKHLQMSASRLKSEDIWTESREELYVSCQ